MSGPFVVYRYSNRSERNSGVDEKRRSFATPESALDWFDECIGFASTTRVLLGYVDLALGKKWTCVAVWTDQSRSEGKYTRMFGSEIFDTVTSDLRSQTQQKLCLEFS